MKNNNEILSVMEDEFVRLIYSYNLWNDRSDYRAIIELVILCEEMEIPFDWEVECFENERETIKFITISGKRIEFMGGEELSERRKEKICEYLRDLLYDSI